MRKLVILTGVSCSGKTTLQNELLSRGWGRPLNFSTRKPRDKNALTSVNNEGDFTSSELDEYLFLDRETFFYKLEKGDFLEHTNYGGDWYGVSKELPDCNICIILDPVGRSQVLEKIYREGIDVDVRTYFLDCSKELQKERLLARGDTKEEILKRQKDFKWFTPNATDTILDGSWNTKTLADIIDYE